MWTCTFFILSKVRSLQYRRGREHPIPGFIALSWHQTTPNVLCPITWPEQCHVGTKRKLHTQVLAFSASQIGNLSLMVDKGGNCHYEHKFAYNLFFKVNQLYCLVSMGNCIVIEFYCYLCGFYAPHGQRPNHFIGKDNTFHPPVTPGTGTNYRAIFMGIALSTWFSSTSPSYTLHLVGSEGKEGSHHTYWDLTHHGSRQGS